MRRKQHSQETKQHFNFIAPRVQTRDSHHRGRVSCVSLTDTVHCYTVLCLNVNTQYRALHAAQKPDRRSRERVTLLHCVAAGTYTRRACTCAGATPGAHFRSGRRIPKWRKGQRLASSVRGLSGTTQPGIPRRSHYTRRTRRCQLPRWCLRSRSLPSSGHERLARRRTRRSRLRFRA